MRRALVGALLLAACGGGGGGATRPGTTTPAPAAAAEDPVARGARLYGERCARCHGDAGQGTDEAPPVVGPDAFPLDPRPGQKRNVPFRTALDVFQWAAANMPADDPGSVSTEDLLAIFAFDLKANGIDLGGKPLDADTAAQIVLHP